MEDHKPALARYACEYCRQRKIKCSRELPKCTACKPWPGRCDYSRQFPSSSVERPKKSQEKSDGRLDRERLEPAYITPKPDASVISRLDRIEAALETLTASVNRLIALSSPREAAREAPASTAQAPRLEQGHALTLERDERKENPSYAFSSIEEADHQLHRFRGSIRHEPEHKDATLSLRDLTNILKSFRLENGLTLDGSGASYIIPDKATGEHMLSRLRILSRRVQIFWELPSEELQHKIIFEPSRMPRVWVVFVNYLLHASPGSYAHNPSLKDTWRWNARVALQSPAMFLEPSHVTIQTFMLLAIHSEDFASPNISWMLMSHSCRQAQALTIYVRPPAMDTHTWQRRLTLFWCLYVLEKWCALAFGRPAFLPESLYKDVPLPSFEYLTRFKPHFDNFHTTVWEQTPSEFGAHVLLQCIELARLTSAILDALATADPSSDREVLKTSLDAWYDNSVATLSRVKESEKARLSAAEVEEMGFGITTMRLRYLHTLLILAKDVPAYKELRVTSARQALEIMPHMATHWTHVYGVIWQLLYYPFTPFFVLFGHVMQNPHGPSVPGDLELLRLQVTYYNMLRSHLNLGSDMAAKLEQTAEVFYRLAVRYTQSNAEDTRALATSHPGEDRRDEVGPPPPSNSSPKYPPAPDSDPLPDLLSMEYADVERFLSWLPDDMSADLGVAGNPEAADAEGGPSTADERLQRGQKRPFDATFDWFSWENYYSNSRGAGSGP